MDQPAEDGQFHYSNKELGFSLTLPAEFEYYQTQRKNQTDYTDVEFFVPTADPEYPQEIASYAKAVSVRVYDKKVWETGEGINQENIEDIYQKKIEANNKVYFMKAWRVWPKDWETKWSEEKNVLLPDNFDVIE